MTKGAKVTNRTEYEDRKQAMRTGSKRCESKTNRIKMSQTPRTLAVTLWFLKGRRNVKRSYSGSLHPFGGDEGHLELGKSGPKSFSFKGIIRIEISCGRLHCDRRIRQSAATGGRGGRGGSSLFCFPVTS